MINVKSVKYISGYSIMVTFSDGSHGVVDLGSELYGEVFEPLKDINTFKKCYVHPELGTVVWENGADFAPEFLKSRMKVAA